MDWGARRLMVVPQNIRIIAYYNSRRHFISSSSNEIRNFFKEKFSLSEKLKFLEFAFGRFAKIKAICIQYEIQFTGQSNQHICQTTHEKKPARPS